VKTFRSIQYLRGLAALAVVTFHAFQWTQVVGATPRDFPTGAAGVDVFFVISGFVMWTSTDETAPGPLAFLWRRAVRILPPYWLFTGLTLAGALAWPALFPDTRATLGNAVLSLLLIPHFDPAGDAFPLLKPGWTLIYEAAFYLIFAVGLLLAGRARLIFLAIALTLVAAAGVLSNAASVLLANPLMLEFLAGVVLAVLWRAGRLGHARRGWVMVGVALVEFAILEALDYRDYDWRPLVWGVPATLLVAGAVDAEAAGARWNVAPLKLLGDASFSIYLCHPLVLDLLAHLAGVGRAWVFIPEGVLASVACGLVARQLIEKPTLRWLGGVGRAMPGFEPAAEKA
jgi:exopolysaccharide production protein ExoZ